MEIKAKMNKCDLIKLKSFYTTKERDLIKLKSFYTTKETIKKMKKKKTLRMEEINCK